MNKFGISGKDRNHKITAVLLVFALLLLSASAIWAADSEEPFIIRYNGNEADSGSISEERVKGTEITLKRNESSEDSTDVPYKRSGCTFIGWSMKESTAEGMVEIIPGGEVWTVDDEAIIHYYDESINGYTLYAWWKCGGKIVGGSGSSDRYLRYDANGADGGNIARQMAKRGSKVTVKANGGAAGDLALTRTGYTFEGWNLSPFGKGKAYQAGDTIVLDQNYTLFAQWKQNSGSMQQIMQNALTSINESPVPAQDDRLFSNPAPTVSDAQPVNDVRPVNSNVPVLNEPLPANSNVPVLSQPQPAPRPSREIPEDDDDVMINPAPVLDPAALPKNLNFYHPETGEGFTWLIDYDFDQQ